MASLVRLLLTATAANAQDQQNLFSCLISISDDRLTWASDSFASTITNYFSSPHLQPDWI